MRRIVLVVVANIASVAFVPLALADDRTPSLSPSTSWSGFYAGFNAGYVWQDNVKSVGAPSYNNPAMLPNALAFSSALANLSTYNRSSEGFIGGGQIGYNRQIAKAWVAGLEADIQGFARSKKTAIETVSTPIGQFMNYYVTDRSASSSVDWLGTLRARLGTLVTPDLLIYGTGGLAYGGVKMSASTNSQDVTSPQYLLPVTGRFDAKGVRVGWTAGAGLEWMLSSNWSAKFEYLHYDLGKKSGSYDLMQVCTGILNCPNTNIYAGARATASARFSGDIVRVGVNYRF